MSEQKYYVILKLLDVDDEPMYLTVWHEEDVSDEPYLYLKTEHIHKAAQNRFTKSELAEIMEGALYTPEIMPGEIHMDGEVYESGYYPEWINPLIELVPVEEEE
ncbi:hypothetical protein [Lactococcus garvieae]|uniref:hypothetical protein n=1 Tax=Lactococcus garvieae TaxID=1363 RepID=UPI0022E554F8|nr:hypothetical protein [Lactococcus garvieae]